jgi:hypothetical protein
MLQLCCNAMIKKRLVTLPSTFNRTAKTTPWNHEFSVDYAKTLSTRGENFAATVPLPT